MAPTKFGLFKTRSRDQPEQPSTENLLQGSNTDIAPMQSPVHQTSDEITANDDDAGFLSLKDLNIQDSQDTPTRSPSRLECLQDYEKLKNDASTDDTTSMSTLQDENFDEIRSNERTSRLETDDMDGASTSCDANSIQFDDMSVSPSEDMSVHCAVIKRPKKTRLREERIKKDYGMWQASNIEVMQNLLRKSGTVDDQIKWQAIATARGLCTLTDNCTCRDCRHAKYLAGMADGDGGLGAAPLFGAMSFGCTLQ